MKWIHKIQTLYIRYLSKLVLFSLRHAYGVILASLTLAIGCVAYSSFYLPINSEQEHLVSHERPFLIRENMFSAAFPQHNNTIIILLEGKNSWVVGQNAERFTKVLKARSDLFKNVFYPQGMSFFHKNGLLYLDEDILAEFTDGLAGAQGAITSLSQDSNLRGLWELLADGVRADQAQRPESFDAIVKQLNLALGDFLANRAPRSIWEQAFPNWSVDGKERKEILQVIVVQPVLDFSGILSGKKAIDNVRTLAEGLDLESAGVEMTLTGREPLTLDELASIIFNIEIAASISTVAIIILLGFGIRSWRLIGIIMSVLFVGMSWTLGWAAISIGELNLISAAFAVLFLGICVDFSIHVALRYREEYRKNPNVEEAMRATTEGAGGAISLCALATAIGFLSFAPTEFYGLRDLGVIAGGSMFLALFASWTLLPALLKFLPAKDLERRFATKRNLISRFSTWLYNKVHAHFRPISLVALFLGVVIIPFAAKIEFDYSALAIKDPQSESVIGLKKLFAYGLFTDYTATILVKNRAEAVKITKQFENLPLVRRVDSHHAFVPKNQEAKLELIDEARFFLAPVLRAKPNKRKLSNRTLANATRSFVRTLESKQKSKGLSQNERELLRHLKTILQTRAGELLALDTLLIGDYDKRIERLKRSLDAAPFTFDTLPKSVQRESETEDGRIKISIYPKEDLTNPVALTRFVKSLSQQSDAVGGRPAAEYEVGSLMVESFIIALIIASVSITLLLLISLRSFVKTMLVLVPIVLTAIWVLALCAWFGIAFNFVNILMLPLLLGLGVANGIHILSRREKQESIQEVMQSSTPVAVFLSNATTLASFGSMSVATHWGLQSMGISLSIGMVLMMISALIVLPAIIAWVYEIGETKENGLEAKVAP